MLLLVLPYLGLCFPYVYARSTPALWGFPFFYWYQFAWVIAASALLATRLPEAQNLSAESWQGDIRAALPPSERRCNAAAAYRRVTFEGGFVLRVVVRSFQAKK